MATEDRFVTGTQDWRRAKWEATHQRIYDTAMRLFEEHGFERVNVGQIASGAGVSVPTFYAHFPGKEHVVLQLPTPEQVAAVVADEPADLPVSERLRRAAPKWFAQWGPDLYSRELARWRVIARTPTLRNRAAEFERATAGMVAGAMPTATGTEISPADAVVVNAYLSAYTAGLLAWADSDGQQDLAKLVDEAFDALQQR
jgi:AcrR family transcriptional regulator